MALAAALVLAMALAFAPEASAGTYRAVQCHAPLGAGPPDAKFTRNSTRYAGSADCRAGGLAVTHDPGRKATAGGRFGAWTVAAPSGAAITRVAAGVSGAGAGWHTPQVFVTLAEGARRMLSGVRGPAHGIHWVGAAGRALTARLVCSHESRCGAGREAHVHLKRIALTLRDWSRPSVVPSGSLLAPGPRRGVHELRIATRDAGAGVHDVTVEVNDDLLDVHDLGCRLAGAVALRVTPCPTAATIPFALPTTAAEFRQGANRVRICAADYARRTDANRTCATRTVRVDNLCPVSPVPGSSLRARFRKAHGSLTNRSDRPAVVTGALRDQAGAPVAGARVCVAVRVRSAGSLERVLAVPTTNARGAFAVKVPAGPSRAIRIAHWPNPDRALESFLALRSRAIPTLRLRPRRRLANGERLRFAVRIPGPSSDRRRVAIQARAGRRWVRVAGGQTSASGVWSGHYTFRSTTGTRRYAFRAVVPAQRGYPFAGGRSRTAHATVDG